MATRDLCPQCDCGKECGPEDYAAPKQLGAELHAAYLQAVQEAKEIGEKFGQSSLKAHRPIPNPRKKYRTPALYAVVGMWFLAALAWWFVIALSGGCNIISPNSPTPPSPISGDAGVPNNWPTRCCYGQHSADVASCEGALPGCTFQFTDRYTDDSDVTLGTCGNLICEIVLH